jgi:hypothetical protein
VADLDPVNDCPTLPSVRSAHAFWAGEPEGILKAGYSVLQRAVILGAALWVAGERNGFKPLAKKALIASLFVEAVVLVEIKVEMNRLEKKKKADGVAGLLGSSCYRR